MPRTSAWKKSVLPHHPLLQLLLAFDAEMAEKSGAKPGAALDDIGLIFRDDAGGYDATPRNVISFAATGGDGVHFSLLRLEDRAEVDWPVVMTVPMEFDQPNLVVGGNLKEFLQLGCYFGYFALEQLVYDESGETVRALERAAAPDDTWPEKRQLLAELRRRFTLSPWPQVKRRLAVLQREYGPLLELQSD